MHTEKQKNLEQGSENLPELASELSQHNMFCFHGIALDSVGLNSGIAENATLVDRFEIAIRERPTLSTSVHEEKAMTSKAPIWSNVGVMISDGQIQAASHTDMSSVMLSDGARATPQQSTEEIVSAIEKIAENDNKYSEYPLLNEVVIKNPEIFGLYFKDTAGLMDYQINRNQITADPNTIPQVIREIAIEHGLPIFAIRTSGVYEAKEFDVESGKYRLSPETAPKVRATEANKEFRDNVQPLGGLAIHGISDD